jgi:hypothetical protein
VGGILGNRNAVSGIIHCQPSRAINPLSHLTQGCPAGARFRLLAI